jgi:hypothetical protein
MLTADEMLTRLVNCNEDSSGPMKCRSVIKELEFKKNNYRNINYLILNISSLRFYPGVPTTAFDST